MSHKSKLLPCPHYGHPYARFESKPSKGLQDDTAWRVSCAECGCSTGWAGSKLGAEHAWNTRTPIESPPCPELVERVARAICWAFSEETDDCSSECFKAGRCMAKEVDETFQRDAKAAIAAIEATRIQTVDEELLSAVENVLRYYDPEREDVAKSLINKLRAAYAKSRAGVTGG